MTDKKAARQIFLGAKKALQERIDSDDFRIELLETKRNSSLNVEGMLVDGIEHGVFLSGAELPPEQEEVVLDFLNKHAATELQSYQNALAAYMATIEAERPSVDRAQKALGNSRQDLSDLRIYFINLDDEQAIAMGSAISSATSDLQSLMATRDAAQKAITARLEQLGSEAVAQGLLSEDVAKRLTDDVSKQLEERQTKQSALCPKSI